jgi:hypothetical protein
MLRSVCQRSAGAYGQGVDGKVEAGARLWTFNFFNAPLLLIQRACLCFHHLMSEVLHGVEKLSDAMVSLFPRSNDTLMAIQRGSAKPHAGPFAPELETR